MGIGDKGGEKGEQNENLTLSRLDTLDSVIFVVNILMAGYGDDLARRSGRAVDVDASR
jgi:hypothetical protein